MNAQILIADDSKSTREALRGLLQDEPGWNICGEAENGQDVIRKARELRPDLVILDINMPVMDGLQAAQNLTMFTPPVRVLLFSADVSSESLETAKCAGVCGYLSKSESATNIIQAVTSALNNHPFSQTAFFTPRPTGDLKT